MCKMPPRRQDIIGTRYDFGGHHTLEKRCQFHMVAIQDVGESNRGNVIFRGIVFRGKLFPGQNAPRTIECDTNNISPSKRLKIVWRQNSPTLSPGHWHTTGRCKEGVGRGFVRHRFRCENTSGRRKSGATLMHSFVPKKKTCGGTFGIHLEIRASGSPCAVRCKRCGLEILAATHAQMNRRQEVQRQRSATLCKVRSDAQGGTSAAGAELAADAPIHVR